MTIHTYIMSCLLSRLSSRLAASSGFLVIAVAQRDPRQRLHHSARAQAHRHSSQPFAGERFFSLVDHRRVSGSGAGSAVTSSGPEGVPRNPPTTELSPDIVSLIKRSVDQATKQTFEAGRQFTQLLTYFEGYVSSLSGSKPRI